MTESLARLTPKTQDWEHLPAGASELTGAEMAACLSGLHDGPLYVARASWIGDESVYPALIAVTLARASEFFRKEDVKRPGYIRDLCCAAISQVVDPPRCYLCDGRAVVYPRGGPARDCDACGGTGRGQLGGEHVRRSLELSEAEWRDVEWKYAKIESVLWGWRATAAGRIAARLRDPEDIAS